MRYGILGLVLVLASVACAGGLPTNRADNDRDLSWKLANPALAFEEWVVEHAADFLHGTEEWAYRFGIWLENLEKVIEYNKQGYSHWLTMNKFAAMPQEEFERHYTGLKVPEKRKPFNMSDFDHRHVDLSRIPQKIDWREKNAVTHVKHQKMCGSCWSFATTGAIEGINAIYSGELVSLSEQELLDCDHYKEYGCDGGWMDYAYAWVVENGGLTTEEEYPYLAKEGKCNRNKIDHSLVSIDGFKDCPPGQEGLLQALSQQPVSVAIYASSLGFQLYGGGIYDGWCETTLNHGVLAVGYSIEGMDRYVLIKNSWGSSWGEHGYIRLALDMNGDDGQCGLTVAPSYPIKTSPNPPDLPPMPEPAPEPVPAPTPSGPSPSPPEPPKPQIQCDMFTSCSSEETCCCRIELLGICLSYGCCPFPDGVCCPDGKHCCPMYAPNCSMSDKRCKSLESSVSVPMELKRAPIQTFFSSSDYQTSTLSDYQPSVKTYQSRKSNSAKIFPAA